MGRVLHLDSHRAKLLAKLTAAPDPLIGAMEHVMDGTVPHPELPGFAAAVEQYKSVAYGKAAAWFVGEHRAKLHRDGFIEAHIPPGNKVPPWWAAVVTAMRKRPAHWRVSEVTRANGTVVWTLTWRRWRGRDG
jgi:hypothetical protein